FLLPTLLSFFPGDILAQAPALDQTPATTPSPAPAETHPTTAAALEVLRDECVACHRTGKSKGGLKLGTEQGVKAGGESGPVVMPGKATESLLFSVLSEEGDPHMPPKKQLTAPQIEAVRAWLEAGVPWDAAVMERPPRVKPVKLRPLPTGVKPVFALSFSPDGSTLAVARGGNVELHDAIAERFPLKSTILAEVDTVASLLWSDDGNTIVTGGFRQIRFWNVADGNTTGAITDGLSGDVTAEAGSSIGSPPRIKRFYRPGRPTKTPSTAWHFPKTAYGLPVPERTASCAAGNHSRPHLWALTRGTPIRF
ncbi:MAG: hypothetical protein EBR81_12880, partial [Proteobacteria bacterium]|nr:hypothetical protein [Pseudomonadota bacterium]